MIDNKESVQLAECSFDVCEALDSAIGGRDAENLGESTRTAVEDSKRCLDLSWLRPFTILNNCTRIMREIGQTLRRKASASHTEHNRGEAEGHMMEIRRILGTLSASNSSPDQNLGVGERVSNATTPVFESGMFSVPHPPISYRMLIAPRFLFLNFNTTACGRLIRHKFAPHELPSLIDAILSSKDEGDTLRCLPGGDAQIFIDVIDEARFIPAHCRESVD